MSPGGSPQEEERSSGPTAVTTYRYDAQGRLIERRNQWSSRRLSYDPRGHLAREAIYLATAHPSPHAELCGGPTVLAEPGRPRLHLDTCHLYLNDDIGYQLRDTQYDREGRPRTVCHRYNERGDLVRQDTRASEDCGFALTWFVDSGTYTRRLQYDAQGNWIIDVSVDDRGDAKSSVSLELRWERRLVYDPE